MPTRRIDLATEPPFQLGPVRVDPPAHEVTFAGKPQRMQPQTLKVLIALHDRIGRVVTRDELVDRCWDSRIVGEDVINRCISLLRRIAAESGGFQIETVPRSGYRLSQLERTQGRVKMWPAVAAGAALLVLGGGWLIATEQADGTKADVLTVAVLPLTEDSQGVHDVAAATRASLSNAMAEGGYPVTLVDRQSGKRPADLLLSGDVQRTASSIVTFVQVEDTHHGVVVYSHRFEADGGSAAALSDQIGPSVAVSLSAAATLLKLDRDHPSDPAVTAALLRSASTGDEGGDMLRAYETARQIAPKAPNSAVAQFSLASATGDVLDDLPRDQRMAAVAAGREAEDRALALAPKFGDAYAAWCGLHDVLLLAQCEDHLRKGLSVDPDAPSASSALSALLDAVGRVDEASQLAKVALASDPYQPNKLARAIRILEEQGYGMAADRLFSQSMRWWPNQRWIIWNRLVGIEFSGDYAALERLEKQVDSDHLPLNREVAAALIGAVRAQDRQGASRACAGVTELRWTTQSLCMTALADLGETDRSFAIARNLFPPIRGRNAAESERIWLDEPGGFAIAALSAPAAASVRRDPRFIALAGGAGLLDYWRAGRPPDFCRSKPEPVCAEILRRRS